MPLIPKEVLDFFPMWEYICPKCRQIYDEPQHACIKCGTTIDLMRDRIPPRFLNNHKAMSDYAHNVLAPKLSPTQRELLFKYFTILFQDGFETLPFTGLVHVPPWTGTGGAPVVQAVTVHQGDYAAAFNANGEFCYINIAGQTTAYMRQYVNFAQDTDNTVRLMSLRSQANGFIGGVERYRVGVGNIQWRLGYLSGAAILYTTSATPAFNADTWYCIELEVVIDGAAGEYRVWIDGIEEIAVTGLDTNDRGNVDQAESGTRSFFGTLFNLYVDCVVVADQRIYCKPTFGGGLNPAQMCKVILDL